MPNPVSEAMPPAMIAAPATANSSPIGSRGVNHSRRTDRRGRLAWRCLVTLLRRPKIQPKTCAASHFGIHENKAAVLLDDPVYDRQPEPCTLAEPLGRKEGLENTRLRFVVHAYARIFDRDQHERSRRHLYATPKRALRQLHPLNPNCQSSTIRHRIGSVAGEAENHLCELDRVDFNARALVGCRHLERDARPQR